jgi:hypothetical protein
MAQMQTAESDRERRHHSGKTVLVVDVQPVGATHRLLGTPLRRV